MFGFILLCTIFISDVSQQILAGRTRSSVEEQNMIKFLAVLAQNYMKTKSDRVKAKFHYCIKGAGLSSKSYARCLIKLIGSKNVEKSSKNTDENLANDVQLMEKMKNRKFRIKKQNFSLLDSRNVVRKSIERKKLTSDQVDLSGFIDDAIDTRYHPMADNKDRANQIINYVSNFFQFISKNYQKTKSALLKSGRETTDFALKILSPRLFTVVDDQGNNYTESLLSPELFSLRDMGNNSNNILSIASLLKNLPTDEKRSWHQFVTELTSSVKHDLTLKTWNNSVEKLYKEYGLDDSMIKNRVRRFFDSLDRWQLDNLNTNGFSRMKDHQLNMIRESEQKYKYKMVRDSVMDRGLREAIVNVARGRKGRTKRALAKGCLLKPSVGAPVIFVHFIVSYVLMCPSALGIFLLGSYVVTPFILSPFVLFPFILAPFVLTPVVLSPFALSPVILAPGVVSPIVLSPTALCPFILTPFVIVPVILSPSALSPLILCPGVFSPRVLSPSILSPAILSPCALCG